MLRTAQTVLILYHLQTRHLLEIIQRANELSTLKGRRLPVLVTTCSDGMRKDWIDNKEVRSCDLDGRACSPDDPGA